LWKLAKIFCDRRHQKGDRFIAGHRPPLQHL
jgi:hypothetical protein